MNMLSLIMYVTYLLTYLCENVGAKIHVMIELCVQYLDSVFEDFEVVCGSDGGMKSKYNLFSH